MNEPTPILSVRQPFAHLIVNGIKDVENRSWITHYTGPLQIHASKNLDYFREDCENIKLDFGIEIPIDEIVVGRIIGQVYLSECRPYTTLEGDDFSPQWWNQYDHGWMLKDAEPWAPQMQIECRGKPGLFYL
tara:strand:+ start:466 stop:861 length:396 start_codon:yes stop_codon:yes gene_type:complete